MRYRDHKKNLDGKKITKQALFYFVLYCLVPVAFFVVVEVILRVSDYGYQGGFFIKQKIGEKYFYVNNYKFSWRFFPKSIARLPASVVVPLKKDENALRVFVFGESAAMGDPDPAFSFSRILHVLLEQKYPDKKIEIYNTAVTAINSHVLLPVVEDCLKLDPDLFIIYAGNNEVIGPFGLSSALSPFFSNRSIIKAKIWLGEFRLGQLAMHLSSTDEIQKEWRGMEMFMNNKVRYDDPGLKIIYKNFQANLSEICQKTRNAGVEIILSTVITNTRDCAPFLSLHKSTLSDDELRQWEREYSRAVSLEDSGIYAEALHHYLLANKIDDEYAELNFRLGKYYLRSGQSDKANKLLTKALELDALRFRADSHINEIIKRVAYGLSDRGVHFADASSFASQQSQAGLVGNDLLYEHVHLNLKGNYLLANCILQQVENLVRLPRSMDVVDLQTCKLRLAYSPFDEKRIDEINLSRLKQPPFKSQYSNKNDIVELGRKINYLRERFDTLSQRTTKKQYMQVIEKYPFDWFLRLNYLRFLYTYNYHAEAGGEADRLYRLLPFEYLSSVNMGITRMALNEYAEAERYFEQAITINPYFSEAYRHMASLLEAQGKFHRTAPYLSKSNLSKEGLAEFYNRAGVHYAKRSNPDSAIAYFMKAIGVNPNFPPAQQNLVQTLKIKNRARR